MQVDVELFLGMDREACNPFTERLRVIDALNHVENFLFAGGSSIDDEFLDNDADK